MPMLMRCKVENGDIFLRHRSQVIRHGGGMAHKWSRIAVGTVISVGHRLPRRRCDPSGTRGHEHTRGDSPGWLGPGQATVWTVQQGRAHLLLPCYSNIFLIYFQCSAFKNTKHNLPCPKNFRTWHAGS
jgi:hypothetical protein